MYTAAIKFPITNFFSFFINYLIFKNDHQIVFKTLQAYIRLNSEASTTAVAAKEQTNANGVVKSNDVTDLEEEESQEDKSQNT